MSIPSFFPKIRGIVSPTLEICLNRFERLYGALGWVDMKFNPATGEERSGEVVRGPGAGDFYRRDRVYGWIQGRALESLVAHARWLARLKGYVTVPADRVAKAATALNATLSSKCFKAGRMTASFVMDPRGEALGPGIPEGFTTLSHLFCLRGLAAYADFAQLPESESTPVIEALRRGVDEANAGRCMDDQIKFGSRGGESYSLERRGYEGQMIALGACEILYGITGAKEDLDRGLEAISYVVGNHLCILPRAGIAMIDAFGPDGEPLPEDGRLATNPGHAIEFAGLAFGFFRKAAAKAGMTGYPREWTDAVKSLSQLVVRYHGLCRTLHGGVVRSMDASTGEAIQDFCPWWSSFEAARTFAEMHALADTDAGREYCAEAFDSYLGTIKAAYLKPSSIGIPVQTISYEGKVLSIIPATPDIDAGYHTGMPLLSAYELFACQDAGGGLLFGAAETEIPPRLGVRLQGHTARTETADAEMDRLKTRCLILRTPWTQAAIISADALEFSHPWSESVCRELEQRCGLSADATLLFATHTHTAPPAIRLGLLDADEEFLASLKARILEAAEKAFASMEPGTLWFATASSGNLGINRRTRDPKTGAIRMMPNPSGPKDKEVPVLWLEDAAGAPRCLVVNPAIHPTALGVSIHQISADYLGRMAESLKAALGQSLLVLPLQGACGDVRPAVLDSTGKEFAEGRESDIQRMGMRLAHNVMAAMAQSFKIAAPDLAVLTWEEEFPFADPPSGEALRDLVLAARAEAGISPESATFSAKHDNPSLMAETYAAWAQKSLAENYDSQGRYIGPAGAKARISLLRLAEGIYLFCLPGEVFAGIGLGLKKRAAPARLMLGGYCGGSLGYMPTQNAFSEGGYEVESAYRFYGYPAALAPGTEARLYSIFDAMKTTLEKENPI